VRFSLSWFSSNAGAGLNVNGLPGNPIDGVHLSNCTAGGNVEQMEELMHSNHAPT